MLINFVLFFLKYIFINIIIHEVYEKAKPESEESNFDSSCISLLKSNNYYSPLLLLFLELMLKVLLIDNSFILYS